jgi:hypothetical protein
MSRLAQERPRKRKKVDVEGQILRLLQDENKMFRSNGTYKLVFSYGDEVYTLSFQTSERNKLDVYYIKHQQYIVEGARRKILPKDTLKKYNLILPEYVGSIDANLSENKWTDLLAIYMVGRNELHYPAVRLKTKIVLCKMPNLGTAITMQGSVKHRQCINHMVNVADNAYTNLLNATVAGWHIPDIKLKNTVCNGRVVSPIDIEDVFAVSDKNNRYIETYPYNVKLIAEIFENLSFEKDDERRNAVAWIVVQDTEGLYTGFVTKSVDNIRDYYFFGVSGLKDINDLKTLEYTLLKKKLKRPGKSFFENFIKGCELVGYTREEGTQVVFFSILKLLMDVVYRCAVSLTKEIDIQPRTVLAGKFPNPFVMINIVRCMLTTLYGISSSGDASVQPILRAAEMIIYSKYKDYYYLNSHLLLLILTGITSEFGMTVMYRLPRRVILTKEMMLTLRDKIKYTALRSFNYVGDGAASSAASDGAASGAASSAASDGAASGAASSAASGAASSKASGAASGAASSKASSMISHRLTEAFERISLRF